MHGIKIIQLLLKRRLRRATTDFLKELSDGSHRHQVQLSQALARLIDLHRTAVLFGTTQWEQRVQLPVDNVAAHALVLGASGAGKSYFALSLLNQLLESPASPRDISVGMLDAKGELFEKAIQYLYAYLYRLKPADREAFKKRVVIIDFSNADVITPYNILARREDLADELMVANRIDSLSDQFAGLSEMSVRMKMILKYFLLLMAEFDLPLPFFEKLCVDPVLLNALVEQSANLQAKDYFLNRFDDESKVTLLALRQRIDALLISEGVRLSLSASTAPDFTALQDNGAIILINTAGRNITRGISELLQGLLLSDIKQSVFRRSNPSQQFLWLLDEAQNLYKSVINREHMTDLLTMARSFGSYFVLLTQSLTSAVRDADNLNSLLANVRWIVMLRSTLRDAELIAPGIAVTGALHKPKHNPFEVAKSMTESEELKARQKEITKFPDRLAYCWLKAWVGTAVKITTPHVPLPHELAGCPKEEFAVFVQSEKLGQGFTRKEIISDIAQREQRLKSLFKRRTNNTSTSDKESSDKKDSKSLITALEEEYAKRKTFK
jgi:hypothetical protein